MQHLIDRVLSEPFMVGVLAVAFSLSMAGFFARIRRDERKKQQGERDIDRVH